MKKIITFRCLAIILALGFTRWAFGQVAAPASNAAPAAAPAKTAATSDTIPEMHVGKDVYYNVRVSQVTPVTLVFFHQHGISSVALADLPPDLQQRFGYDPAKAAAEVARRQRDEEARKAAASALAAKGPILTNAQKILQHFGEAPKIFAQVNMRPHFDALGIGTKDMNPHPSSAISALLSAYEYQRAPVGGGGAPQFSDEYSIWATLKAMGKTGLAVPQGESATLDVGFTLPQAAEAIHSYGVAFAEEVPYHFDLKDPHVLEPPADVIERAKKRTPTDAFYISGRDASAKVANLVQVLNAGVPVTVSLNWPEQKEFADNVTLDLQPGLETSAHVVVIVGYRASTGKIEETQFLFKNCYGVAWGDHGYGLTTYKYLVANLHEALFFDVE